MQLNVFTSNGYPFLPTYMSLRLIELPAGVELKVCSIMEIRGVHSLQ